MENSKEITLVKREEMELSSSWWSVGNWWKGIKEWRKKQKYEMSREINGRVRGRLTALEARNLTMYGKCNKTLEEIIFDEVCRIEDQINFKGEQRHDTYIATSIEHLDIKVREGIIKHFKEAGFMVYKTTLQGHPNEKTLIIDWTPNTTDEEKVK